MDKLTADQLMALSRLPPYVVDWDDLIVKHWGDEAPERVYEFLNDIRRFQENLLMLQRERKAKNDNQVCAKCDYTSDIVETIKKHVDCLSAASQRLIVDFFQLQRELNGNRDIFVLEDLINETLVETDEIYTLAYKLNDLMMKKRDQMSQD